MNFEVLDVDDLIKVLLSLPSCDMFRKIGMEQNPIPSQPWKKHTILSFFFFQKHICSNDLELKVLMNIK